MAVGSASVCSAKIYAQSWNFRTAVTSSSGSSLSTSLLIELPPLFVMKIFEISNTTKIHTQKSHLRESQWAMSPILIKFACSWKPNKDSKIVYKSVT